MDPNQPQWQYKPAQPAAHAQDFHSTVGTTQPVSQPAAKSVGSSFGWSASEYLEHQRSPLWYVAAIILTAVISAGVYLITKDKIATMVMPVLAAIILFYSFSRPKAIACEVSSEGIKIGGKTYAFGQFRSFGIIRETNIPSLELKPVKKLMPMVSVHFDAKDEQQITSIVGNYLPYEEIKMAGIDKLSHRLKI